MEYEQLQAFFIVLLGMCALIAAVSGACAAIVKFWRYAHRQSDEDEIYLIAWQNSGGALSCSADIEVTRIA